MSILNSTPLPKTMTQPPEASKPAPVAMTTKSSEPNYIGIGVIGGFFVALLVLGGVYYKMKMDLSKTPKSQGTQVATIPTPDVSTASSLPSVTPVPTASSLPVIQSSEDLTTVQNSIDETDFSSISSELEKNMKDAANFSP